MFVSRTIHFVLFVRNCIDRKRGVGTTPRIMYLPTGQPVVVLSRPFPPLPTHKKHANAEHSPPRTSTTQEKLPTAPPAACQPQPTSTPVGPSPLSPFSPASAAAGRGSAEWQYQRLSFEETPPSADGASSSIASSSQAQAPRRKPVPVRGTHLRTGDDAPGPDYVPDRAERTRAARGEAQAQWVSMDGLDIVRRPGGPAEKFLGGDMTS